jgi:phosphate transport system substrate-binding protein
MEQLVNGEVSMSLLLRELTDPEVEAAIRRDGMQAFPVAWDAVAVIVNPDSPIEQISRTELAAIYRGETKEWASVGWRQGGGIIALTSGPQLGIFAYLEQALLGGDSYAPSVYAPATEEEVVEVVATRRNALACVSRPLAASAGSRVKSLRLSPALGLASIPLTRETLFTRQYPLLRPISIATGANPVSTVSNFINFVSGMDGQRIIARHGYAPGTVPIQIIRTAEGAE